MLRATDNLLKEAEEKVVYRRFEQEHLGKLQTPADITQRLTDSGVGVALQGMCYLIELLPPPPQVSPSPVWSGRGHRTSRR